MGLRRGFARPAIARRTLFFRKLPWPRSCTAWKLLRANPRIAAFLKWMRRQRGASFAVRRARERG